MRIALLSVLGALLVGCGDDGVNIAANQDNFCETIADVVCHNLYQCCTESEIEDYLSVSEPRTELQCIEDRKRDCQRDAADIRDSLQAGRITFDATRLNDCLNAIVAPENVCSAVVTELPYKEACKDSPFVGTVATGGTCFFNHDCAGAPDSFCGPDQKCKQKPQAGFPCSFSMPCASQFYCATNGTCAAKLAAGAPCTGDPNQCAEGLFCDSLATPMPVCAARHAGGEACTADAACTSGDCVPGQCMGTTQTCFTDAGCQSRCAGTGFSCTTAANCGNGNCSISGTTCNGTSLLCNGGTGDTCVFPVQCLPGDCVGDPICTSQTLTVDYCTVVGVSPNP